MTQTTDRLAEVLEKLTAIREVVREAHFALDDSEDQSHLDPPVHAVPCDNANRLDAALTACEAFMPDNEAWYGPGPLVTQVMDSLQSLSTDLAKAEAVNARLREALAVTREKLIPAGNAWTGHEPHWQRDAYLTTQAALNPGKESA